MENIQFRSTKTNLMQNIAKQLEKDLLQADLANDLQVGEPSIHTDSEAMRGDPVTWTMVALAAVGTGGALTALLGKDGFLSALARILEKYVEGRQAEILIEKDGEKIEVKGNIVEIKKILQQIQQG